jgi:excisionase family DNA binding protein
VTPTGTFPFDQSGDIAEMTPGVSDLAATLARLAQVLAEQASTPRAPVAAPRPTPERVLLTVEEAAARLGIGRTFAWRLVRTGDLESVRIGRLRRIHVDAVRDYAARLISKGAA